MPLRVSAIISALMISSTAFSAVTVKVPEEIKIVAVNNQKSAAAYYKQKANTKLKLEKIPSMCNSTPTENLRALAATNARTVIYSSGDQPALVREASRAGGFGMIRKSTSAAETVAAVPRSCTGRRSGVG